MSSLDDVPKQEYDGLHTCPEQQIFSTQQSSVLVTAIKSLPLNQKLVVELKFFQQCTFEDIAIQMGISANTAKSQLYSALDKSKVQLARKETNQAQNGQAADSIEVGHV